MMAKSARIVSQMSVLLGPLSLLEPFAIDLRIKDTGDTIEPKAIEHVFLHPESAI